MSYVVIEWMELPGWALAIIAGGFALIVYTLQDIRKKRQEKKKPELPPRS